MSKFLEEGEDIEDIHKVLDSASNTIFLNTFHVGSSNESRKYGVFRKTFESLSHVNIYPTITSLQGLPVLQGGSVWMMRVSWCRII